MFPVHLSGLDGEGVEVRKVEQRLAEALILDFATFVIAADDMEPK